MSVEELLKLAREHDPLTLSSRDARRLSRQLRALPDGRAVRVAYAGNVVLDPLAEFVEAQLAIAGLTAGSYVAPFGQALQELLDPAAGIRAFAPTVVLLHFEFEALLGFSRRSRAEGTTEDLDREVDELFGQVEPVVRAALAQTSAIVLLTNFVAPEAYALGMADTRAEQSEAELVARLNSKLARTFRAEPRVQGVDLARLTAWHGRSRVRDRRLYYVAKLPWHESFLPVLADELVRHVLVGLGRVRKCLVVDLDNTLWGGVLGEDGPLGVKVGAGDPIAEAHFDLQRRILGIKQRGVLLAACSKNNPADVEEVFRLREEMPLRREDFVGWEVGWEMKHEGLRRIAERLNIGTDSLVFLDDNPAEIDLVRQLLPEVQCVLVPADPALRPACLDRVHGLERAMLTTEDQQKTRQYQENAARESTRQQFATVNEYLQSLRTRVTLRDASPDLLARAHQLFTKTNQFNVTTRRYSLAELQQCVEQPSSKLVMVRVEDRFGDIGWAGAVLLRQLDQPQVHLDSFILSCRVMGRGVETAVLNTIKAWCFETTGADAITAEYLPTAKNGPVRHLFEQHGFAVLASDPSGGKTYRLARDANSATACDWIAVEAEMAAAPTVNV